MPAHTYEGVKIILNSLGGPPLNDTDLDAVAGLEAGKILLAWLHTQLPDYQEKESVAVNLSGSIGTQAYGRALVRDVALEKDEVPFTEQDDLNSTEGINDILAYIPPSGLRTHARFIKAENDHIRRQIEQLTFRISKTKEVSTKLLQSIRSLQRSLDVIFSKTRIVEERIADLSINTDAAVSTTISDVKQLLQCLGHPSTKADGMVELSGMASGLESAGALLLNTSKTISSTASHLRRALNAISIIKASQPAKIRDLQDESIRLKSVFNAEQGTNEDLQNELQDICLLLEREASAHSATIGQCPLTSLLSELDHKDDTQGMVDANNVSPEKIFQYAWVKDQIELLKLESDVLDEACLSLSSVLEPLQSVHEAMFTLVNGIHEGEAVVEALVEELEDIQVPDIETGNFASPGSGDAVEMERELKRVLMENQDCRHLDAPPLLLQDRDDILAELRALSSRLQTIEQCERHTVKESIHQSSIRPLHAALPEIYGNSPLNSCPPFSFPTQVQQLEGLAKKTADELREVANSLEEECQNIAARDSNMKRLDFFVEKWMGS